MPRQITKPLSEIKKQYFLSIGEIKKLYSLGYPTAKKVYQLANEIDEEELGKYRITQKVRKHVVEQIVLGERKSG